MQPIGGPAVRPLRAGLDRFRALGLFSDAPARRAALTGSGQAAAHTFPWLLKTAAGRLIETQMVLNHLRSESECFTIMALGDDGGSDAMHTVGRSDPQGVANPADPAGRTDKQTQPYRLQEEEQRAIEQHVLNHVKQLLAVHLEKGAACLVIKPARCRIVAIRPAGAVPVLHPVRTRRGKK